MHGQFVDQICNSFSDVKKQPTSSDQKVLAFLLKKKISPHEFHFEENTSNNLYDRLEALRELLKVALLAYWHKLTKVQLEAVKKRFNELAAQHVHEMQLETIYLSFIAHLLKIDYPRSLHFQQFQNGIFSLSKFNYWNLLKYPFIHFHAEFAILVLLMGKMSGQPKLMQQGYAAAKWHLNMLGNDYLPFRSLFSNYQYCNYYELMARQACFFYLASLALEDTEIAFVAKKQFGYLLEQKSKYLKGIPLDILLILRLTDQLFPQQLTPVEPNLDKILYCKELSLMGVRKKNFNLVTTLSGCNTSMGNLKLEDLEMAGFGPQLGNLGDGKFFGSIATLSKEDLYQNYQNEHQFCVQGIVGLPSTEQNNNFKNWQHVSSWLKTKIQFQDGNLQINVQPITACSNLYFTFYLLAPQCLIKGQKKFLSHSLEQFNGKASNITFLSPSKILTIELSSEDIDMKIIPLEGQSSFWGANFLLAYSLSEKIGNFCWKISVNNR